MIYVCSDIHGRLDRYNQIFDYVKADDTVYILGDVIDRHPYGMEILIDIIKRPNVILLAGNHEHMMYLSIFKEIKRWYDIWVMKQNGGRVTFNRFCELMDKDIGLGNKLEYFLRNLPLFVRVEVNGKKFHLSHVGVLGEYTSKDTIKLCDVDDKVANKILWDGYFVDLRDFGFTLSEDSYYNNKNETYISGHVKIQTFGHYGSVFKVENYIDIDGGCASSLYDENNCLILYRLDDDKEFIIV